MDRRGAGGHRGSDDAAGVDPSAGRRAVRVHLANRGIVARRPQPRLRRYCRRRPAALSPAAGSVRGDARSWHRGRHDLVLLAGRQCPRFRDLGRRTADGVARRRARDDRGPGRQHSLRRRVDCRRLPRLRPRRGAVAGAPCRRRAEGPDDPVGGRGDARLPDPAGRRPGAAPCGAVEGRAVAHRCVDARHRPAPARADQRKHAAHRARQPAVLLPRRAAACHAVRLRNDEDLGLAGTGAREPSEPVRGRAAGGCLGRRNDRLRARRGGAASRLGVADRRRRAGDRRGARLSEPASVAGRHPNRRAGGRYLGSRPAAASLRAAADAERGQQRFSNVAARWTSRDSPQRRRVTHREHWRRRAGPNACPAPPSSTTRVP